MQPQTKQLLQAGVEAKRQGNFSRAVEFYTQAIKNEPNPNSIMWISLAKSMYLQYDFNSVDVYIRALSFQILEHALNVKAKSMHDIPSDLATIFGLPTNNNQIEIHRLLDEEYQMHFLQNNFGNTLIHLAHSYVDLRRDNKQQFCHEIFEIMKHAVKAHAPYPSFSEFQHLVEYEIQKYAYDLASGGIIKEPKQPNKFNNYFDFIHIYLIKGSDIARESLNWKIVQSRISEILD